MSKTEERGLKNAGRPAVSQDPKSIEHDIC